MLVFCQSFNPTEAPKGETAARLREEHLDLDMIDIDACSSEAKITKQYQVRFKIRPDYELALSAFHCIIEH